MKLIPKPKIGEYAPYTIMYIDLLPDHGLVLDHLQDNLETTSKFVRSLPEKKIDLPARGERVDHKRDTRPYH